jgi:hypothetical protein
VNTSDGAHAVFQRAAVELRDALHPTERIAAQMLARAQLDVATARASSPEEIADEAGVTDPQASYDEWLALMVMGEQRMRDGALRAVADGSEPCDDPSMWFHPDNARAAAAAVDRARDAIAAMTGSDPVAAAAAREYVIHRWRIDDIAAEAHLALTFGTAGGDPC